MPSPKVDTRLWEERYKTLEKEYADFAYVISHDLHAPLRQIKGFTQILFNEIKTNLNEEQQLYYDMVQQSLNLAQTSLDAILVFSRLNTEDKIFESLKTADIVGNVLNELKNKIEKTNARIKIENLPETITADRKTLHRALYCLIDNAIKFQPEGQMPRITINAEHTKQETTFCIQDNGIGMDPENLYIAFIIFRRLNADEQYEGSGAGLTYAKKIAQIHGGDVKIKTTLGKGTTACLTIRNKY